MIPATNISDTVKIHLPFKRASVDSAMATNFSFRLRGFTFYLKSVTACETIERHKKDDPVRKWMSIKQVETQFSPRAFFVKNMQELAEQDENGFGNSLCIVWVNKCHQNFSAIIFRSVSWRSNNKMGRTTWFSRPSKLIELPVPRGIVKINGPMRYAPSPVRNQIFSSVHEAKSFYQISLWSIKCCWKTGWDQSWTLFVRGNN